METKKNNFSGTWIPKEVFELGKMPGNERIILSIIINLENEEKGCFASNKYFANILHIKEKQVSKYISKLFDKKLISSEILNDEGNKRILRSLMPTTENPINPYPFKEGNPIPLKGDTYPPKGGNPIPLKGDAYNKDYKKENIKDERERPALLFLKEKEPKRYEAFINTYKDQIKKFDKFLLDFNDTVELENLPFEVNRLFIRWKKYARNYINNEGKFDSIEKKETINAGGRPDNYVSWRDLEIQKGRPTYLNKIL